LFIRRNGVLQDLTNYLTFLKGFIMPIDASAITSKTSPATSNSSVASNTVTPEKPTGAAGGKQDSDLKSKINGLLNDAAGNDPSKAPQAEKQLMTLVTNDPKAKDVLTQMASGNGDKKITETIEKILQMAEATEKQRNPNAPVIAQA